MTRLNNLQSLSRPIAFSHYSAEGDISGVTSWLQRLLLRLHRDGVPLVVYLLHFGKDISGSSLYPVLKRENITVEIELFSPYVEENVKRSLQFLNRYQPAAYFPQCLDALFYGAWYAGRYHVPWAITMHSDANDYWAYAEQVRSEQIGYALVGVSDYITQKAKEKKLSRKTLTIPCGVPSPSNRASFDNDNFVVVYSGRLVEHPKRISLILETMKHACLRNPRISGLLIGEGVKRDDYEKWVVSNGLKDRIRFTGRISEQQLMKILPDCHVFLLMSDYEGMPVAMMEAMVTGVVPVARYVQSGVPELVINGKTGVLTDDDPKTAGEAIVKLSNDKLFWERYSQNAISHILESFSENVTYERWINLMADLVEIKAEYPIPVPSVLPLPPKHPDLKRQYLRNNSVTKVRRFLAHSWHAVIFKTASCSRRFLALIWINPKVNPDSKRY